MPISTRRFRRRMVRHYPLLPVQHPTSKRFLRAQANTVFPDMTVIKYVEPPPMGSAEEPKSVTTTITEYDLQQLRSLVRAQLMGIAMMCFMHFYFKYTNPLVIQSVIPLKSAFEGNLIKIHVLGYAASGEM